ncbi:MAG: cation diffusion facilitator family transporter [Magnetococcales bacterium]|nr:cation diffusion facilitator family transporter [Magnetococcales bacterium]
MTQDQCFYFSHIFHHLARCHLKHHPSFQVLAWLMRCLYTSILYQRTTGVQNMPETATQPNQIPSDQTLERVGWMSMGVNVLLIFLNVVLGWFSGSIAVMAEALHNFVDMVGSVGVIAGLKLSRKKSADFPYGLYKVENIVALTIAALIFLAGYEIAKEAILSTSDGVKVTWPILTGVILSLVIPVLFSAYELRIGKQANSPSIIADGEEFRMHALSSGAVLLGLCGQYIGWDLDRWASLFVVVFILQTGWELSREAMRALLDASLDSETLHKIQSILESDPLTVEVKSVTGRNAGRYRFLEAAVILRTHNLVKAETACRRMETAIRNEVPHLERVLIHSSPVSADYIVCAIPVSEEGRLLEDCFCHAHSFYLSTIENSSGNADAGSIHTNPFITLEHGKGIQLGKWLVNHHVDLVLTRTALDGKGLSYVLSDAGVEVRETPHERVADALANALADVRPLPLHLPASGNGY